MRLNATCSRSMSHLPNTLICRPDTGQPRLCSCVSWAAPAPAPADWLSNVHCASAPTGSGIRSAEHCSSCSRPARPMTVPKQWIYQLSNLYYILYVVVVVFLVVCPVILILVSIIWMSLLILSEFPLASTTNIPVRHLIRNAYLLVKCFSKLFMFCLLLVVLLLTCFILLRRTGKKLYIIELDFWSYLLEFRHTRHCLECLRFP